MEHLETVFADAIICSSVDLTSGNLVESVHELNDEVIRIRKEKLQTAEDLRTFKCQVTETLSGADQKLSSLTSKVLELESVISLVRLEAETKLKDMSAHASALYQAIEDISRVVALKREELDPETASTLSTAIHHIQSEFHTIFDLQRNAISLPASSVDLFTTVNSLNNALTAVKRKANMRIRKLTDENTDMEHRVQQLHAACSEAVLKLSAQKKDNEQLRRLYEEFHRKHQEVVDATKVANLPTTTSADTNDDDPPSQPPSQSKSNSSKALQMQILLLQEECANLRKQLQEKQLENEKKVDILHASLVQAAKEHEHERRHWKQEISDVHQELDTLQSTHRQVLSEQSAKFQQQLSRYESHQQQQSKQRDEEASWEAKCKGYEQQMATLTQAIASHSEAQHRLQATVQQTKESLRLSEESLKNVRLQLRSKEKQVEEVLRAHETLQDEFRLFKSEAAVEQKALQLASQQVRQMQQSQVEEQLRALTTQLHEKDQRIFQLSLERDRADELHRCVQEEMYGRQFELDRVRSQTQQLQAQLDQHTSRLEAQDGELQQLRATRAHEMQSQQQEVAALQSAVALCRQQQQAHLDETQAERLAWQSDLRRLQHERDEDRVRYEQALQRQHDRLHEESARWRDECHATQHALRVCRAQCHRQDVEMGDAVCKVREELLSLQQYMAEINALGEGATSRDDT